MSARSLCSIAACAALMLPICLVASAQAQCCGGAPTAVYQPAAYTAYSPVVYQSSGWYPGYFLDRIRTRLFGSPSTYVAAYPSTYVASYPSPVVASYPSAHVASYPSTYVASYSSYTTSYAAPAATYAAPAASYAAPACTTCAPQVTLRPVCETCPTTVCDPCAACGVTQASYQQPSECPTCNGGQSTYQSSQGGTTIVVPNGTVVTPGSQQPDQYNIGGAQPELDPSVQVGPRETQRPVNGQQQQQQQQEPVEPAPGTDDDGVEQGFEGEPGDNGAYWEAPQLFMNPNDRTAQRQIGRVQTAVYKQPVSHRRASAVRTKITAQQAAQDAIGWTSASK